MGVIGKNIRILRAKEQLSQEQLAEEFNVPRSRIAAYEEGRAEPNIAFLIALSDYFKVSVDIMIKVDLSKTDVNSLVKIGGNRILLPILIDEKGNDKIEVINYKASAGYLNGYADPEFIEQLPTMKLPFPLSGKVRAFPIKGNSMPPADTGDYIVGKYVESLTDVKDGETYVLLTKQEGLVYKRVYAKGFKNAGYLQLISDNPAYEPYKVNLREVLEIWEYVCLLRMSDKKSAKPDIEGVIQFLKTIKPPK